MAWEPRVNGSFIATGADLARFADNNQYSSKKLYFDHWSGEVILMKESDMNASGRTNYLNITPLYLEMERGTFF